MLDDKDIERIVQALEPVFATKEDLRTLGEEFSGKMDDLLTSVDAYAHKADTYYQEMVMLFPQSGPPRAWILQLAEKLGVTLRA